MIRDATIGPETPVRISQLTFEFEAALELYRIRKPKRVLEIGTFWGGTLYHWLKNAAAGATVVTVDSYEAWDVTDNRHLFRRWCPVGVTCVPIVGDSTDPATVAEISRHGPFDWVFIDALHTYRNARADWDNYRAQTSPGACVLLHDIVLRRDYPETGETAGVWQLWAEIQSSGQVTQELLCDPAQTEYGIGIVYLP